jgi:Zn-dependent M28 family amino/carboxypeptidase
MRVVAILLGLPAVFSGCAVWMPGESFRGEPPPLTGEQEALASRLRAHVVMLADEIGERNLSHYESLERARAYVVSELTGAGWIVTDHPYDFAGETFHNVEAMLPGASDAPGIVVGAHYDSAEGSPGANDNGSGVAALIELGRLLRPCAPAAPLRLVAFANEEPPYFDTGRGMGSAAYVRALGDANARVRCMLSLETMGFYRDEPGTQRYPPGVGLLYPDRGDFIAFVANPASRGCLRRLVGSFRAVATIASEGAALPAGIPGVAWSDHRSFWEAGIPAVMVTDTAPYRDPAYHRASDTPERLDYARLARVVDGLAHALVELAAGEP